MIHIKKAFVANICTFRRKYGAEVTWCTKLDKYQVELTSVRGIPDHSVIVFAVEAPGSIIFKLIL